MTEEASSLAAFGIFGILLIFHLVLKVYARFAPSGGLTEQERQLLKEIKELNKSANELSSPATFSKSAKLKRQAAAKEKELSQLRQELSLRKGWNVPSSTILAQALKAAVYILLVLWFWRTPVATVPVALLKPSDYFLKIGKKDVSGNLVAVGIIAWLVMSSRVSEFLSDKIVGKPPKKPATRKVSLFKRS
ncbi:unnamed protein product [Calypogeia fissa]